MLQDPDSLANGMYRTHMHFAARWLLSASCPAWAARSPTEPTGFCEMFGDCATARRTFPRGIPRDHCAYNAAYDHDSNGLTCEPGRNHPVPD